MERLAWQRYTFLPALALALILAAGCTGETPGVEAAVAEVPVEEVPAMPVAATDAMTVGDEVLAETVVGVYEQEPYGQYVVDGDNSTLYIFTADERGESSACYNACAKAWPPLLAMGEVSTEAAVIDTTKLGTIERRDGSMQVTYYGWPLYYYAPDNEPTVVKGQGIRGFGGVWYLISPEGEIIKATEAGSSGDGGY